MKTKIEAQAKLEELTNELETTNSDISKTIAGENMGRLDSLHHHKTQVAAQIGAIMWVLGYEN